MDVCGAKGENSNQSPTGPPSTGARRAVAQGIKYLGPSNHIIS